MAYVKLGQDRIYTEVHGEGEDLLLVPGLGGRAQFWASQVGPLSKHFRVILHDHRGTGRSSRSNIVYGAKQMAEDLLRVMDGLKISSAHLVGHSTGGAIGQYIALTQPERLKKLVLSCSWCGPDPLFVQLFETRKHILISSGPGAYYFTGTMLATPAWYLQSRFTSAREFLESRMKDFPGLEIELSRLSAVMSHDLRSHVHKIAVPTMVIGAEDDQITPPGFSRELAARIPKAKLTILPKGGHFCPMTVTEEYNKRILAFLSAAPKTRKKTKR
ncbi:MAG: alpha/beta fold hydrolase [Rhodospirillaceae bacterium]|nr:alpha/beta fold hydrolase [Rhodospirillaceae bacterium]